MSAEILQVVDIITVLILAPIYSAIKDLKTDIRELREQDRDIVNKLIGKD